MSVFRDLSSWEEEQFLHETGRFCEILWNLFKIPKSVWQSPASVLWPDFPVCIASVRGPDLIMWSETVLVKLLNHHFLSHWPQSHFLGGCFSVPWHNLLPNTSPVTQCLTLLLHNLFSKEIPLLHINYLRPEPMSTELLFLKRWVSASCWEGFWWWGTIKAGNGIFPLPMKT